MHVSRYSIPVRKTIDRWPFNVNGKRVDFIVEMQRTRDPEDKDGGEFKFFAESDKKLAKKNGADAPEGTVEADSLPALRDKVLALCRSLNQENWEKVIVVGVSGIDPTKSYKQYDAVQFEYTICERLKGAVVLFRDLNSTWCRENANNMVHAGFSTVQVYPHTDSLERAFERLNTLFAELVREIAFWLQPQQIGLLEHSLLSQPTSLLRHLADQNPHCDNTITAKDGLLWRNGKHIPLPEADRVAVEHGYPCAEQMVHAMKAKSLDGE